LDQFRKLTILEIEMVVNLYEILSSIGDRLLSLRLSTWQRQGNQFSQVLKVFDLCANLECLHLGNVFGSIDLGVPFDVEKVGLKKLMLEGNFVKAKGFVPLISRAPKLNEVIFNRAIVSQHDINSLIRFVSMGMVFQNVTHFVYALPKDSIIFLIANLPVNYTPSEPKALELILKLEFFAKNIISFCPLLQNATFNFEGYYYSCDNRSMYSDEAKNGKPYHTEEKRDIAIFLRELRNL
jgi:hypothetical protein